MFLMFLKDDECAYYLYTECFFNYSQHNTRQHYGRKIDVLKFNRQCDRHNFVAGGVNDWNSRPTNFSAVSD